LPDGLFVPVSDEPSAPLRFVPLPPPTTAEVGELTRTIAGGLSARLTAASEEDNDYLDPDLAALMEALFWSRDAPPGTRDIPLLPGLEGGREEEGLQGKPLCAAIAGFSLHATQCVQAHDREALERLLRYGLRAPFSQERLSRCPDEKVVYQLRRPLAPETGGGRVPAEPPPSSSSLPEPAAATCGSQGSPSSPRRRRCSWSQLRRRVLDVDGLACARCWPRPPRGTRDRTVPMVVLAFLTDPEVVGKILRHLRLPLSAPSLAPARLSGRSLGFVLPEEGGASAREEGDAVGRVPAGGDSGEPEPSIRPPP
jgi:hypothetical protein